MDTSKEVRSHYGLQQENQVQKDAVLNPENYQQEEGDVQMPGTPDPFPLV